VDLAGDAGALVEDGAVAGFDDADAGAVEEPREDGCGDEEERVEPEGLVEAGLEVEEELGGFAPLASGVG